MTEQVGGRVALVTGASSGIGLDVAGHLAQAGWTVYGTSRRSGAVGPSSTHMLTLDVTDEASVQQCVDEVIARSGQIDLLVNNAGFTLVGAIEESSARQVLDIFDTNVFGPLRMIRAVLPHMRARRSGRIVNISSVVGFLPAPFSGLYASTKHALEAVSESLDHEVRTHGIRSVLIEPGFTASNIGGSMPVADRVVSDYTDGRTTIHHVYSEALAKAPGPGAVARAVLLAATTGRPKVRYAIKGEAGTLRVLRRLLPTSAFERSFRKQLQLPPA